MRPLLVTAAAYGIVRQNASCIAFENLRKTKTFTYKSFNRDDTQLSTRPQTEITKLQETIVGVVCARRP